MPIQDSHSPYWQRKRSYPPRRSGQIIRVYSESLRKILNGWADLFSFRVKALEHCRKNGVVFGWRDHIGDGERGL